MKMTTLLAAAAVATLGAGAAQAANPAKLTICHMTGQKTTITSGGAPLQVSQGVVITVPVKTAIRPHILQHGDTPFIDASEATGSNRCLIGAKGVLLNPDGTVLQDTVAELTEFVKELEGELKDAINELIGKLG